MQINIDLRGIYSVMNKKFYFLLDETHRIVVCRGGAGSSKSYSIIQALIYFILRDLDKPFKHKILCLRKTSPAVKKSIYPLIKHIISEWGLDDIVTENKTDMSFRFVDGSELICSGLDDEQKLRSIFGLTKIFLEEINEFRLDDYRQANLRLRGIMPATFQVFAAFNPVSKTSWVFEEFFAKTADNVLTHHSTYKDNRYLDDNYKDTLEDLINQDQNYYNVFCLGEWGSVGNLIYENWEIIDKWPDHIEGEIVYGLDFGWNHPMALVKVAQYKNGFVIDEVLYESEKTVGALIEELPDLVDSRYNYIFCDSSRPDSIEEIFQADWNVQSADKRPGSVKDGIDFIKRHRLYITNRSVGLIKEIQGYSWKMDKDGNKLDEPVKFKDDGMDAMRYAIFSYWHNQADDTLTVFK